MCSRIFVLMGVTVITAYAIVVSESAPPVVVEGHSLDDINKQDFLITPKDVKLRRSKLEAEIYVLRKEVLALTEIVRSSMIGKMAARSEDERLTAQTNSTTHSRYRIKRAATQHTRQSSDVAFHAVLMHEKLTTGLVTPIKFNDVITNENEAYNAETGIFTAPRQGTYFFSLTVMTDKGHYVEASIHMNDRPLVTAVSDDGTQGSIDAMLNLKTGDKVHVAIIWPSGPHTLLGAGKSGFLGYLVNDLGSNDCPKLFHHRHYRSCMNFYYPRMG